jgi:hypothetical protein
VLTRLSADLIDFIRRCIPTYQAAEVLLFFAAHPERSFSPEDVVVSMRPVVITLPAAKEYLRLFAAQGLVAEDAGRFAYAPRSADLEDSIGWLAHAYNETPVTLIRVIYQVADANIQSFADAFKLRRDEP